MLVINIALLSNNSTPWSGIKQARLGRKSPKYVIGNYL